MSSKRRFDVVLRSQNSWAKGNRRAFHSEGVPLSPLLYGGNQESGRRSGTENVPGIIGLAEACKLAYGNIENLQQVSALRDQLERELLELFPASLVNGKKANRLPNTLNIAFENSDSETLLHQLSQSGVYAAKRIGMLHRFAGLFARLVGDASAV